MSFKPVDLNGNGKPLLVAVYTNFVRGAVRVIDRSGKVLAAPVVNGMRGLRGSVEPIDVDADGVPEILVQFTDGQSIDNPDSWVYKWSEGRLKLISPTRQIEGMTFTCLRDIAFADLSGEGRLAILNPPVPKREGDSIVRRGIWRIFRLVDGSYVADSADYSFIALFEREEGEPFEDPRRFSVEPGPSELTFFTGASGPKGLTGRVTLNGTEIIRPEQLAAMKGELKIPVDLQAENTLDVKLEGKPGSRLTVRVSRAASAP